MLFICFLGLSQKFNRFSIDANVTGIKYFLADNYSSKLNLGFNSNLNYYRNNKFNVSLGAGVFNKNYLRFVGSTQNQTKYDYTLKYQHLTLNFGYVFLRKNIFSTEINAGISYLKRSKCDLGIYDSNEPGVLINDLSIYKKPILTSTIGTTFSFTFFDKIKLNLSPIVQYKFLKENEGFQDYGLSDDRLNFNFQIGIEYYFN